MVTDTNFINFRVVYDELTDEVSRARYQFLPDHLLNWFKTLDTTPKVASIIQTLQSNINFEIWWQNLNLVSGGVGGSRRINWPDDHDEALGMKLLLFRAFAEKRQDISRFGFHFIHVGNNINDNARAVVEQIFEPMARELRRHLERELSEIPAADRIVKLDHNSGGYRQVAEALEKLEQALREANDYPDVEEKEQRIAEVSASRRLLEATQVRVEALVTLLRPVIVQFTTKVKENLITAAALAVSAAIIALLGHIF